MKIVRREPTGPKPPSAIKRARARLQAKKRAAAPPEETFLEDAECARTAARFTIIWKRANNSERFTVRQIAPQQTPGKPARHEEQTASAAQAQYAVSEFDYTGYGCPICNAAGGLIYCGCGKKFCQGGNYKSGNIMSC